MTETMILASNSSIYLSPPPLTVLEDKKLLAWAELGVSSISLALQLLVLPMSLSYKQFRELICYKLMLSICFFDMLQLVPIVFYIIIYLCGWLPNNDGPTNWLERLFGASFNVAWNSMMLTEFSLALNRLVTIVKCVRLTTSGISLTSRTEQTIFKLLHGLAWAYYFIFCGLFLTPFVGAKFDTNRITFGYDMALTYSRLYSTYNLFMTSVVAMVTLMIYLVIIAMLKMSRKADQSLGQQLIGPLTPIEFRILLQSLLLFPITMLLEIPWFFGDAILPQFLASWHFNRFVYLAYLGLNPILYLTINPVFRGKFGDFYWRHFFSKCYNVRSEIVPPPHAWQ